MLHFKKKTNITDTQGLLQELDEATSNILANNMSNYISTTTSAGTYNNVTMGAYGNGIVSLNTPRLKSTSVLMAEREELLKNVASEYENVLSDKLPDSTKEEVRELTLTIVSNIWDIVAEKQWELWESTKNYTVTL